MNILFMMHILVTLRAVVYGSVPFVVVPKLEGAQREMPPLSNLVNSIDKMYGQKKDLILMDNNITASARYKEVIAEIRDLGFTPGAKIRGRC